MLQVTASDTREREPVALTKVLTPQPRHNVLARFTYAGGGFVNIELPRDMKRVSRVWLMAYYLSNPSSTAPLQLEFSPTTGGKRGITSGMSIDSNACNEGSIVIPNFAMTSPLLMAIWKNEDGCFKTLGVKVRDNVTGNEITYTDMYLWLDVETVTWFWD